MSDAGLILIVDDELANIQSLAGILDHYDTIFATNGSDALALAGEQGPDLILLDVMMPDNDDYEVCSWLKADDATSRIPVIFVTGRSEEGDEEHGLRCGAVDYIHKPISPPIVRARVDNHVLLKRYSDELASLSKRDPLTGLANRRAFEDLLPYDWQRARRNGQPLSLVMIDIDAFKAYNDHYGHPAGDRCLAAVAAAVGACARRAADMACRLGGEEFACMLPETPPEGATVIAERVRGEVESLACAHAAWADGAVVTVSVGVATAWPDAHADHTGLVTAADEALYEAKQQGRNRVVVAEAAAAAGALSTG